MVGIGEVGNAKAEDRSAGEPAQDPERDKTGVAIQLYGHDVADDCDQQSGQHCVSPINEAYPKYGARGGYCRSDKVGARKDPDLFLRKEKVFVAAPRKSGKKKISVAGIESNTRLILVFPRSRSIDSKLVSEDDEHERKCKEHAQAHNRTNRSVA